jgi:hypothetical protein
VTAASTPTAAGRASREPRGLVVRSVICMV